MKIPKRFRKNKEKEEPIPIYERFNQRERLAILLLLRRIAIIVPEVISSVLVFYIKGPVLKDWNLIYHIFVRLIRKLGSLHGDYPRIQDEQRQSKWKIQASPKKCTILPGSFKRYDSVIQFLSKKCPGEWPPMATDTLTLVNGEWIIADGADTDHVVLFLHGGAYWTGDIMMYQGLGHLISKESNSKYFGVRYRLAPQHPYPCALIDAVSAYLYLLESYPPAKIVIMGDSAGGGLSIATIMVLRDMQLPLPAGGFCLSPWVDLTLSCDSMQTNKHTDFLNDLNIHDKRLINRIHYYTADEYLKEDYISPFWSTDFGGLPPLLLQAGGAERLLDEIVSISVAAAKHNKSITLEVYESHVHVFHMTFPFQKGAQIALTRAGEWIKSVTNRTSELSEISQRIELSFLGVEKKTSLLWKTPSVKQLFG
ncbi:Alpha/Beta hydrolase protein [Globomyces pollinis-pini]|nr:Alpha/Beta hydrolase protein [Globomyces pollinis-pini]